MDRNILWSIGLGALLVSAAVVAVMVPERKDPAFDFIPGNKAVTEDQVREKVELGWVDERQRGPARAHPCRHGVERRRETRVLRRLFDRTSARRR